jgi:hypothetical protein
MHRPLEARLCNSVQPATDHHRGTYLCQRPTIDYLYTTFPVQHACIDNAPVTRPRTTCFTDTLQHIGSDHYPVVADV